MKRLITLAVVLFLAIAFTGQATAGTLDTVKQRGYLQCGINGKVAGFGFMDERGNATGFDVDFCRALAAAIGVDVRFTPLTAQTRFTALQSGEIDVLFRNTTWTTSRDTDLGLDFAGVNYYDGQGFMVRKSLGVSSLADMKGATVCVQTGTTTEANLSDYSRANGLNLKAVVFENADEARTAYDSNRCDSLTTDVSGLAATRSQLRRPSDHTILPEVISKEPLGPATRHGDNQWTDIVRWVLNGLILAEELGVTKGNVARMRSSTNPEIQRLLGQTGSLGANLGLKADFMYNAIRQFGNFGEIFERHIGLNTPVGLPRGINQLWNKGGILYPLPMR